MGHQRRRLREPGRIPKRSNFALGLIARPGAAVKPVVGRRAEEKCFHPFLRIRASKSSRWELSPLPQVTVAGSCLVKADLCAPFTAFLASARCPLPVEKPLKASTRAPAGSGLGLRAKLYLRFFQLSPRL